MKISKVHTVKPSELRFTITEGDRRWVRFVFIDALNASPVQVGQAIADNINHWTNLRDNGYLHEFDVAEHVAGIERDAARYGTD